MFERPRVRSTACDVLLWLPPAAALALVLVACGGGGGAAPADPLPPPPGGGPPFGLASRVPLATPNFPLGLADPLPLDTVRAFPNLTFQRPVFLTHAPDGTDRIFVVEQDGRIFVFPNVDSVPAASVRTFLDLRAAAGGPVSRAHNEEGLLGLAFSPDYATSGAFYVHYSAASPRRSVIARYAVSADPDVADPNSETLILQVAQPFGNHNAGMLAFGSDGMFYVALGDGGSGNDPQQHGQNTNTLLGSILRIDPRGGEPYAIPGDNPLVGAPGLDEIWAWGLRNPWRFSFDRQTGDLWAGDVGQITREEIDIVRKGDNLGWRIYEGDHSHLNPDGLPPEDFTGPVVDYGRSLGSSVTGGYVYRGQELPSYRGAYVYGDYGSGRVWALVHDGRTVVSNQQVATVGSVASFGEDRDGELYAVSLGGSIWRFEEASGTLPPPPPVPERLSETGLFADVATLSPTAGLIEYDVNSPLWSDGTLKRRWIGVPGQEVITFTSTGAWSFPVGTVIVKHFEILLTAGDPSSARRLETRALVHEEAGWRGYAYRWNPGQTDADLLTEATSVVETLTIQDPAAPGGVRQQDYEYPSRAQCLQCHTAAAGRVLGVRTQQLNRAFDYPAATDNQLRSWNHIGLFHTDIGDANAYSAMADPADPGLPVALRARSYLSSNCASCHRPGGTAPGGMDLRHETPDAAMNAIDVRPSEGDLGLPDAWRIRSGVKESSVLWERMRRTDGSRMPPLASHVPHDEAIDLIGTWIDGP
ncbi:MAG: PQQ-dependent sugar dehydrogenase [Planctomycetota bacterium]|jgi:uncharacterized repeat protein (TIGR03806 family)